jgi:AMMECR1 domain-containing protein
MTGIDGSIITNAKVWEASGHVESFCDIAVVCKKWKNRFKVDENELAKAVCDGSKKYPKLEKYELPYLTIQINIFSALHQIYEKEEVEIGKHGLYVNHPEGEGLLFPIKAVEMNFDEVIFLNEVCHKAGLPSFTWEDDECEVFTFETIVFSDIQTQ